MLLQTPNTRVNADMRLATSTSALGHPICVERALGHENEVSLHPKSYSHMSVAATATIAGCTDDSSEGEMSASGGCDDKHISAAVASVTWLQQ